ncbi:MAG: hypothetical protein R3C60_12790 [Parvularculaceae bacterium]
MTNRVNFIAATAALAATISTAPASAQEGNSIYDSFSANNTVGVLSDFGVVSQTVRPQAGGSPIVLAQTQGGAKFLVAFFSCDDAANSAGCKQALVSTAQPAGGIDFDAINNFNGHSSVTTAVYESSNQILLFGRNIYAPGGVSRDNFKLQISLFLSDMQRWVEGRQSNAKSVAFAKTPDPATKITSITAPASPAVPNTLTSGPDIDLSVTVAIDNSLDVNFTKPAE